MTDEGMPYLGVDDLVYLFGYKNKRSLYESIRRGHFPVKTYKLAGRIVADREAVKKFFREKRDASMDAQSS